MKKTLLRMFSKSNDATRSLNENILRHEQISLAVSCPIYKDSNEKLHQCYVKYLSAYNSALTLVKKEDFLHAKLKADEAFDYLIEVEQDVIPATLGSDFIKITSLFDLIESKSTAKKY